MSSALIFLILFAVAMFLWLLAEIQAPPPAGKPWNRLGLAAWFAVLFLFLALHPFHL